MPARRRLAADGGYGARVSVRLPSAILEAYRRAARRRGVTVSFLIREVLVRYAP